MHPHHHISKKRLWHYPLDESIFCLEVDHFPRFCVISDFFQLEFVVFKATMHANRPELPYPRLQQRDN